MTRTRRVGICLLLVVLAGSASLAISEDTYGFSVKELRSALDRAGLGTQRLCKIQTFGSGGTAVLPVPAYVAVLSTSRSGWQVSVFRRVAGGFLLEWSSRKLPSEFSVSSPDELSIQDVGDEPVVVFSGCAPHDCGGTRGVAGFLLYSTLRKQAFYVRYIGHSMYDTSGSVVTFSKNVLEQENQPYKEALRKQIDSLIRLDTPLLVPESH